MVLLRHCFVIGLQVIVLAHFTHSFVLLTANINDVKKLAKRFVSDSLAEQIAELISKINKNDANLSEENEKSYQTPQSISNEQFVQENNIVRSENKIQIIPKVTNTDAPIEYKTPNRPNDLDKSKIKRFSPDDENETKRTTTMVTTTSYHQDTQEPLTTNLSDYEAQTSEIVQTTKQNRKKRKKVRNKPHTIRSDSTIGYAEQYERARNLDLDQPRYALMNADDIDQELENNDTKIFTPSITGLEGERPERTRSVQRTEFDQYSYQTEYLHSKLAATSGNVLLPKVMKGQESIKKRAQWMYNYGAGVGSSSQERQYQGYPYTSPMVIDVPTIDSATAARYTNLPRKPWVKPDSPVVYIDIPDGSGQSSVCQANPSCSSKPEDQESPSKVDPDSPVVYIDIPSGSGQSSVCQANPSSSKTEDQVSPSKVDPDENPVVYIDVPQGSGSDVAERRVVENEQETFVQETIFYDPFKDRRIEVDHSDSEDSTASATSSAARSTRPTPPSTLSLRSPTRGQTNTPVLPDSYTKESSIYGPVSSPNMYPEPPPAYTERDAHTGNAANHGSPTVSGEGVVSPVEPIRTQVIIAPESNPDRKLLYCIFCGMRGHSLIIKHAGFATHFVAGLFFIFGMFPLLFLVYCTDIFKYKNHYCKNCNEQIAYEIPFLCKDLTYRN